MADESEESQEQRDAKAFRSQLETVIRELTALFKFLRVLRFPSATDSRLHLTMAIGKMVGIGIRQLRACMSCVDAGNAAEAPGFVRTVWELAIDAAYVLSKSGPERQRLSEHYFAMEFMRLPFSREAIATGRSKLRASALEAYDAASAIAAENPKSLNPNQHWNGTEDKGAVRAAAYKYLDDALGPDFAGWAAGSKSVIFGPATLSAHADPGSAMFVPADPDGWVRIEPDWSNAGDVLSRAAAVGILLFSAASQRGESERKTRGTALMLELFELLKEKA